MKHTKKVRGLSLLLTAAMVLGMFPINAYATETEQVTETTEYVETNTEVTEPEVTETTEAATEAATEATGEIASAEPVKYTVAHYLWNWELNDYVLVETEELTGMPGELTNAQEKAYEGCVLENEIEQVEILEDGTTVVAVYYIELLEEGVPFIASDLYDTSVSGGYFKVIEEKVYDLAPGAQEYGFTLNNADGTDRKLVHVFAVDTKNEDIQVMPGYYGIDKLDPDNLALEGVVDKKEFWQAKELTKTVAYYEGMGCNVVGGMNTALAYDSDAPYGYMVWNGVVLGTPEVHKGAQTYLAIDKEGNCELRSMSEPLAGNEQTAISANFGWLVKDGKLTSTTVERTSSDASRSMIGIKEDGTLIFCHVDGRQTDAVSGGLSNYEMGEMMLALGCVNAVNCDGGGSSTFVSKRAGETVNTMRSIPSDGSERPTINSVILVSTAGASGIFDKVLFDAEYEYIAPGASMAFTVTGQDSKQFTMDIPAEVTYQVADGMGTVENGVFTAGSETGTATIQAVYNGNVVGEMVLNVVHPEIFGFAADSTVIPYGRTVDLVVETAYGDDDWAVCVDGAYTIALSNKNAATLDGNKLTATKDESVSGVDVIVTYTPNTTVTATLRVEYGKGSEIVFDFENGEQHKNFLGTDEMFAWAEKNGATAPIQKDGNYSDNTDSVVFLADQSNGKVKNGDHALGVTLDYTDATFASWSYNMFFHVGESIVLRDVANGRKATTFGMWVYIPEGAAGLAMQIQGFKNPNGTGGTGGHFYFTTAGGAVRNLNSCTEADIPASRWVYATCDLTQFGDYFATYDPYGTNGREPSFIRFYVKPTNAAKLTFYFDDFTLDYSSAVDDRHAPSVGEIAYASGDVSSAASGVTIPSGSAAFSASVADTGTAGLNTASAQIFLDGNPVDTVMSGSKMVTANDLTLSDGPHVVTFEIADNLGNFSQKSAEFTVKVSENKGIVYLDGHNDSGKMPEYDSVYYVDIKTSDAASVNYVEANIQLNTANRWELEHMVAAPGYEVEYVQLDANRDIVGYGVNTDIHSVENVVAITLTRTDDCTLTGEQTLLSIPVRLWSWDGFNHITGDEITREEQFKSGYCPIVSVDYSVLFGYAETTSGDVTFGGSKSVATKINDTVYPWHYHDEELTILNQAATCIADGYENRSYCNTCESVVDWGTKLEATGHTHSVVDNELKCTCGHTLTGTGLVTANDKVYCLIADKLVTGWQAVGNDWCYAEPATKEVRTGAFTVNNMTYTADENGVVVKGAWVTDAKGTKYSYGPQFNKRQWVEIEGAKYYFGEDSYMYTGLRFIPVNRSNPKEGYRVYKFAEDGKLLDEMLDANGIITSPVDGMFYVQNGTSYYGGLMHLDTDGDGKADAYYYARTSGQLVVGKIYWITKTNDILPAANYTFGEDGKMLNPPVTEEPDPEQPDVPEVKNGIVFEDGKLWWYVDGVKIYGGLMHMDTDGDGKADAYYYARSSGEILTNRTYWITKTNDILPTANYTFGADGKMLNPPVTEEPDPEQPNVPGVPEVKNGIVSEDGKLWWYVDGVKTYGGLMHMDTDGDGKADAYYYARSSGEILTNRTYWISKTNDLLPVANYTFGADGKMIDPPATEKPDPEQPEVPEVPEVKNGIVSEDGKLWWYVDGVKTYSGLMLIDGDYYYVRTSGEIVTNRDYWISKTNDLLSAGKYTFGADGKMINPPVME